MEDKGGRQQIGERENSQSGGQRDAAQARQQITKRSITKAGNTKSGTSQSGGQRDAAQARIVNTLQGGNSQSGGQRDAAQARIVNTLQGGNSQSGGQRDAAQARIVNTLQRGNSQTGGQRDVAQARPKTHVNEFKIMYTNADSLPGKLVELRAKIASQEKDIQVIAITETWAKNSRYTSTEGELQLEGYELHHSDLSKGRGICIYVKKGLTAQEVKIHDLFEENLNLLINLNKGDKILISAIYRSPNSDRSNNDELNNYINELDKFSASHKLVVGDFNFPTINWTEKTAPDGTAQAFLESIEETYWTQHIVEPTRKRGSDNPSLLDLLFTNEEDMISEINMESPLGKSDHSVINASLKCSREENMTEQTRYFYNRGDYNKFRDMMDLNWMDILREAGTETEDKWKTFEEKFIEAHSESIPHTVFRGASKPWPFPLEENIRKKIKEKNKAWRRYMTSRSNAKYREYTRLRNQLRNITRKARSDWEKSIADDIKVNPKRFWKYVSSKMKVRQGIPDLTVENGTATTDKEKAESLNKFFASVFVDEPSGQIPTMEMRTTSNKSRVEITEEIIRKKLEQLNISKSPGPDSMHPRVLKELSPIICRPLNIIFNTSLNTGKLPSVWKEANVCAIFKKGARNQCTNYRPVSLTSVACKVMESIIRDDVMNYLMENHLFSKYQYGFIPKRSTVLQLLNVLDKWTEALDCGRSVEVAYMDFQKAFDTVPHKRLINKLSSYGLSGTLLDWLKDFFTNRKQAVRVNGAISRPTAIRSGIPQGSVLGPILFVLFINDLPDSTAAETYLFADDTKIFSMAHDKNSSVLQEDLKKLQDWTDRWLLKFHPDKCKHMSIPRHQETALPNTLYLTVDEIGNLHSELKKVQEEKDLGMIIDHNLNSETHINSIVNRGNRTMGIIRRTFDKLEPKVFLPLYTTLVRSTLEYGQAIWSPFRKGLIKKLESVQRTATRKVNGMANLTYPERLRKLKLPSLRFRRMRGDAIETFKIIHNLYDEEVSPKLKRAHTNTRGHTYKLYQERANNLDIRKHFFRNRTPKTWNSLPEEVVTAPSLNAFKNRLDKFWKDHPILYDPDID